MRVAVPSLVLFLTAFAVAASGADDKKDNGKASALDPFKQLAGEWVGKEVAGQNAGQEIRAQYKVTSGGSAVVETLFPGNEHEMVTVIHRDGDALVLTHYCSLGNQPRMRAPANGNGKTIAFKFADATNLKSDKDMHMHDVAFTFVDKDTLKTEWTHYQDCKAAGKAVFEFKRKK